ncbi:MAG: ChbG/HpnK family deacetylase, partial [Muribaculaceae bacterium]
MIKVIINADDLGKSSEVNKAIGNALDHRLITSSTILANSITWEEVHAIVDRNPQASFGVHLNLTEGRALTSNPTLKVAGIVDENNVFTKNVRNLPFYSNDLLEAIKNEWDAQLDKVINIERIHATHIDGHHHIHTFFPFRFILIELLRKYELTKVRNRYNFPNGKVKNLANVVL